MAEGRKLRSRKREEKGDDEFAPVDSGDDTASSDETDDFEPAAAAKIAKSLQEPTKKPVNKRTKTPTGKTTKTTAAPTKTPTARPRKKRKIAATKAISNEEVVSSQAKDSTTAPSPKWELQPLPPHNIGSGSGMKMFSKARENGLKIKKGARQKYTPLLGGLQHIRDYPRIRDFRLAVDQVQQYEVITGATLFKTSKRVNGVGIPIMKTQGGKKTKVWCIKAFRQVSDGTEGPVTESIEYFVVQPGQSKIKSNAITEAVCATREDAIRLGHIVVDFTNRFPEKIESSPVWEGQWKGNWHHPRVFIELAALHSFSPDMDMLQTLGDGFVARPAAHSTARRKHVYMTAHVVSITRRLQVRLYVYARAVACWFVTDSDTDEDVQMNFGTGEVDDETVARIPPLPRSHELFLSDDCTNNAQSRVHKYCASTLFGKIGSPEQFKEAWDTVRARFSQDSRHQSSSSGVFNDEVLFSAPYSNYTGRVLIRLQRRAILSALDMDYTGAGNKPEVSTGLYMVTASHNLILHAYIRQEVINSIFRDEGLLNAISKGHAACAQVDSGRVTVEDAIASFDQIAAAADPDAPQMCCHCPTATVVAKAFVDDMGRRLCHSCATTSSRGTLTDSQYPTLSRTLLQLAMNAVRSDSRFAGRDDYKVDGKSIASHLTERYVIDADHWQSACSPGIKSVGAATWSSGNLRSKYSGQRLSHPEQMSLGKPYPMYVKKDGTLLHCLENTFVQTLVENFLQGPHAIGLLPSGAEVAAAALDLPPVSSMPSLDYPEDLAPMYEKFERMCDNSYMILGSVAYCRRQRLNQTIWNASNIEELLTMLRSCKWDGKIRSRRQGFVTTRAGMRDFSTNFRFDGRPRQQAEIWEGAELDRVLKNVKEIVEPFGKFNPYGLILTANGDGSYWLGRKEERPDDANIEFEFYEHRARWWTWDEDCDEDNETDESPETILYESLIQTIRSAGKCHGIKIRLSVISGHFQVYSWGRATHHLDAQGNPTNDIITAGDPMRTGCTVRRVTDIKKQYDYRRCTVVRESWALNHARSNFPLPNNDISMIVQAISKISVDREFCDPVGATKDEYPEISLPRKWTALYGAQSSSDPPIPAEEINEMFMSAAERVTKEALDDYDDITKQKKAGDDEEITLMEDPEQEAEPAALCRNCLEPKTEGAMLSCSALGCSHIFHFLCHTPPLLEMPTRPFRQQYFCVDHLQLATPDRALDQRPTRPHPPSHHNLALSPRPQHSLIENATNTTCYADTSLQSFIRLSGLADILQDSDSFVCNPTDQSGRTYRFFTPEYLADVKTMCLELRAMTNRIFSIPGSPIESATVKRFFSTVSKVDNSFSDSQADEASGFFSLLIDTVVTATDISPPRTPNALFEFYKRQTSLEQQGTITSARDTASQFAIASTASGRTSPLQALFRIFSISERECGEAGCPGIVRSYDETNVFTLKFPDEATDQDTYPLTTLLANMANEELQGGAECPMVKSHTSGTTRITRFTSTPKFFSATFNRQGTSTFRDGANRMSQVELPDDLDLAPYSHIRLPSDSRFDEVPPTGELMYRLRSVIMYRGFHYVVFIQINGEWVSFDGTDPSKRAYAREPRVAAAEEGWVPALVIYERVENAQEEPIATAQAELIKAVDDSEMLEEHDATRIDGVKSTAIAGRGAHEEKIITQTQDLGQEPMMDVDTTAIRQEDDANRSDIVQTTADSGEEAVEEGVPGIATVAELAEWWNNRDNTACKEFVRVSTDDEIYTTLHAILLAVKTEGNDIMTGFFVSDIKKLFNQVWASKGSVHRFENKDIAWWGGSTGNKYLKEFMGWIDRKSEARADVQTKAEAERRKGEEMQGQLRSAKANQEEAKAKQKEAAELLKQAEKLEEEAKALMLAAKESAKEQHAVRKQRQVHEQFLKRDFFG